MSRFVKIDSLPLPPGCCFICRKSDSPTGFADLGFSDDWLGAFYACGECVIELGRLFGMWTSEAVKAADETLIHLRERVIHLEAEITKLAAVRQAIQAYREDGSDDSSGVVPADTPGRKSRGRPRRAAEPVAEPSAQPAGEAAE